MIEIIKKAALEAMEAAGPARVYFGTVISTTPLAVKIDQKFTVPNDFILLTRNVTNYETTISIADLETEETKETEKIEKHKHLIKVNKKKITIYNALKTGDIVVLLQMQGGQKYIVIDKVGG